MPRRVETLCRVSVNYGLNVSRCKNGTNPVWEALVRSLGCWRHWAVSLNHQGAKMVPVNVGRTGNVYQTCVGCLEMTLLQLISR